MKSFVRILLVSLSWGACFTIVSAEDKKPKPPKPVAGKADVMKHVHKRFATFLSVDPPNPGIRLHFEGDEAESVWPVLPDAEVKIHGWWGRLDQLRPDDRVWVWLAVDRDKKPKAILMIADELSEEDIHGEPAVIKAAEHDQLILHHPDSEKVPERILQIANPYSGPRETGDVLFAQTSGQTLRQGVNAQQFETLRREQQDWLRQRWRTEGLPGTVSALHPLGGEMELLLDHEAMRWGRYLKNGDQVTLQVERPIKAVVNWVRPWRERTQIRLVTNSGLDQLDLSPGQRIGMIVPEPPAEVQGSDLPPDLGRLEGKQQRLDWFLNTVYCSCGITGDKCTGMFYVQASCNLNACGMPNEILDVVGGHIDQGLSDREIFNLLVKERGRDVWRPHLLR